MASYDYIGDDDFVTNPSARLPVCLCLDISGSMNRDNAIARLNDGVESFYDFIKDDEQRRLACEIAIVTFNSEVNVADGFSCVDDKQPITFIAEGGTALAHGVERALDLLEERKRAYKANGVEYYQPILVIMTDGKPGDKDDIPDAQERTKNLVMEKKLSILPIVVGSDGDDEKFEEIKAVLDGFGGKGASRLKNFNFNDFFEWLGKSVSAIVDAGDVTLGAPDMPIDWDTI